MDKKRDKQKMGTCVMQVQFLGNEPQPLVSLVYHKNCEKENKTSSGIERFNRNSMNTLLILFQNDANEGKSCRYM